MISSYPKLSFWMLTGTKVTDKTRTVPLRNFVISKLLD